MWFVTYFGDLRCDPLDKGVRMFNDKYKAEDFADMMENKGYSVSVYLGQRQRHED